MTGAAGELGKTPLYDEHVALGARLVPFAGFAMPVQYAAGIRVEHHAVRTVAGLFDVSHMGEFRLRGPQAMELISYLTTNDPAQLEVGQAQYTVMCLPHGGIVDDLIVYKFGQDDYRLVVNATNMEKDWRHVAGHAAAFEVELHDESAEVALLALQGPVASEILRSLTSVELDAIGFYRFALGDVAGVPAVISRTGYTGEDGFELYVESDDAPELWRRLLRAGEPAGLVAAGLGARDTLRLEMGYALYGNDIDEESSPLEAGLSWLVKLGKEDFVGRESLLRQKKEGVARRLRGFRLTERGFPRPGYEVIYRGEAAGSVRSGTLGPTLGFGIGTAYLSPDAAPGEPLSVRIRGRELSAEVTKMPFYTGGSLRR